MFDLRANGQPEKWSWTALGSDDAWLALDRDGDGAITSGAELFGNYTPQADGPHKNGFRALAVVDVNGDGMIDVHDPVYEDLKLWVDRNHDGISQPEELYSLQSRGIAAINLSYSPSARTDRFGNVFRYRSHLMVAAGYPVNRNVYDVFLSSLGTTAMAMISPEGEFGENGEVREASSVCNGQIAPDGNQGVCRHGTIEFTAMCARCDPTDDGVPNTNCSWACSSSNNRCTFQSFVCESPSQGNANDCLTHLGSCACSPFGT